MFFFYIGYSFIKRKLLHIRSQSVSDASDNDNDDDDIKYTIVL